MNMTISPIRGAFYKAIIVGICGFLISVSSVLGQPAQAQQIGKEGWQPSPRSKSLSAQFEFQKRLQGGGNDGMDALTQYFTEYNTSSTSIGNYTEVVQSLGEGATGTVSQTTTQDSSGSQQADTTAGNSETTNGSFNATVAGSRNKENTAIIDGLYSGQ